MAISRFSMLDAPSHLLANSGAARNRCCGTLAQHRRQLQDVIAGRADTRSPTYQALAAELELLDAAIGTLANPSTKIISAAQRREEREAEANRQALEAAMDWRT